MTLIKQMIIKSHQENQALQRIKLHTACLIKNQHYGWHLRGILREFPSIIIYPLKVTTSKPGIKKICA